MSVIRCKKGHYYDSEKFSQCPHCGIFAEDEDEKTVMFEQTNQQISDDKTIALRPIEAGEFKTDDLNEKTVSLYKEEKGVDYIVGWLVCIRGPEKGRDYKLYHGFNRIGRDYTMAVAVMDDLSISKEACLAVVYESKTNQFYAVQQPGGAVYLNGILLESPKIIETGTIIELGNSTFEFIAFCREGRVWEKD